MTATIPYTNSIDGWMFPAELTWLYETAKRMQNIAEVGCWKGRSTHALLSGCPGFVYAIDHWQGSQDGPELNAEAAEKARRDFLRNCGDFPNLHIIGRESTAAAEMFGEDFLSMVFIDGAHDYDSVLCDLIAWLPKTRRIIAGHDYSDSWPGVVGAVEEVFTVRRNMEVKRAAESIWYVEL